MEISPRDWKIFRIRLPQWQEAYMKKLCLEYIALLRSGRRSSEKFWELDKRIKEDKKKTGVVTELKKSRMIADIVSLLEDGAIGREDLSEFSAEVQEAVDLYIGNDSGQSHNNT